jgi:prepilin-type N-terminal cleavage/methylation domain-containing protein
MRRAPLQRKRRGFTLVELLVVIAIIAVLIGLLLPAVQKIRERSNQAHCMHNLHQLTVAVNNFHSNNGTMPPYFGVYPRGATVSLYGSWFAHLLPYVEEEVVYNLALTDIRNSGFNSPQTIIITPAVPPSGPPTTTTVPPSAGAPYNGYDYGGSSGGSTTTYPNPGTPAVTQTINHGIWLDGVHDHVYKILQCPSDPSNVANEGLVYGRYWGSTNYVANWFAWGNGNSSYNTPPQRFTDMTDGTSQTILFGEQYAQCDRLGRIALYSWWYQDFGLNWYGQGDTRMFQVQPLPLDFPHCPPGADCCDNWAAQTGHNAMSVAMADGSVRSLSRGITQETWELLLQPRDGQSITGDY